MTAGRWNLHAECGIAASAVGHTDAMSQKPSLGRIVLTFLTPEENNGSEVAPALITRVWSDDMVNVTVFPDAEYGPVRRTSVRLVDSQPSESGPACWWPPRA